MDKVAVVIIGVAALAGVFLWSYTHVQLPTLSFAARPNSLVATPLSATAATVHTDGSFDETGTIVFDGSDGPNGIPYILYTNYSSSGKPSIATKRLVFAGESGCQASALPCATRPPSFPVAAGEQVHVTGIVDAQNVFVESFQSQASETSH